MDCIKTVAKFIVCVVLAITLFVGVLLAFSAITVALLG